MMEMAMLKSKGWESLGNASRVAYLHLKAETFSPNPQQITLLHREMERIMTHPTFAKAIRELEKNGFIERTQHGGLYRRRNVFKLSEGWKGTSLVSRKETFPIQGKKLSLLGD